MATCTAPNLPYLVWPMRRSWFTYHTYFKSSHSASQRWEPHLHWQSRFSESALYLHFLVPSPSRSHLLESYCFALRQFLTLSMPLSCSTRQTPCFLYPWGESFVHHGWEVDLHPRTARKLSVLYILWGRSLCLPLCETDLYLLCSRGSRILLRP